jgi:hypothetical protein
MWQARCLGTCNKETAPKVGAALTPYRFIMPETSVTSAAPLFFTSDTTLNEVPYDISIHTIESSA